MDDLLQFNAVPLGLQLLLLQVLNHHVFDRLPRHFLSLLCLFLVSAGLDVLDQLLLRGQKVFSHDLGWEVLAWRPIALAALGIQLAIHRVWSDRFQVGDFNDLVLDDLQVLLVFVVTIHLEP